MSFPMRLFIYEYACAESHRSDIPDSVRREGRAMFDAVMEDATLLYPEIEIISLKSGGSSPGSFPSADYALIIAPEFDGILASRAEWAMQAGCQLLGPLPEAIRLTADKWSLYEHWKRQGVCTPRTWLPSELPTTSGRYLRKHRYGAGSLGIGFWSPGEPVEVDHLVQEYIDGVAVSLAMLISPAGHMTPLLPCKQHISRDGHFSYEGGSILNDSVVGKRLIELATLCIQGIPGLQGYVGLDAMVTDNEIFVVEINPRLTTSYLGLRALSKENLVSCLIKAVTTNSKVPLSWFPGELAWSSTGRL